ncbi:carbonic anhydrase [Bradyrhizobium oligotrophicum]|uniref:carbonic anhydrase n=1 Tax=Bradyrhizobium oligotrophicum TaxID=44255 RepID=UPI003EB973E9
MDRRHVLKALAGLALCPVCATPGFAAEGGSHHWSYEGNTGPAKWGDLDAANKVCGVGTQQSPVNIENPTRAQLPDFRINWTRSADTIVNNGHTIQLNFADGSGTLNLAGTTYKLMQVHFHRPSEHQIGGRNFPMEAHFVHRAASGNLAVVGVLMTTGRPNPAFAQIVATMPGEEGPAVKADPRINPNLMLPARRSYYRYAGSLTTPPCSEVVEWLLLSTPISVADADVAKFAKLYPMNARPVQQLDRRFVLRGV